MQTHEVCSMDARSRPREMQRDGVVTFSHRATTPLKKGNSTTPSEVPGARLRLERGKASLRELRLGGARPVAPRSGFLVARRSALSEAAWKVPVLQRGSAACFKVILVTGREQLLSLVWSVRSAWRRVASPLLEWAAGAQALRCTHFCASGCIRWIGSTTRFETSPPSGAQRACRSRSNHL